MARKHAHKWEVSGWHVQDRTVKVDWHCTRKACPWVTESEHTFRRPRAVTTKVALATREYKELLEATWPTQQKHPETIASSN